jgi:tetratricopeptide (TPR) repeat protein
MAESQSSKLPSAGILVASVRVLLEMQLVVLVLATPWLFGSVEPLMEFGVLSLIGLMLGTWAMLLVAERRFSWHGGPFAYGLGVLFVITMLQLVPLPHAVLRFISPGTAWRYDQLLPARPEQVPGAEELARPPFPPPGSTLSLYPTATRQFLLQVLAVWMLFLVVRHELADMGRLRRFAIMMMLNGAALALFGIIQSSSSPPNMVYWRFTTSGEVFGPFINRNHFATYVNMCLGLGLGFVLCRGKRPAIDYRRQRSSRPYANRAKPPWFLPDPPFFNYDRLREELDDLLEPVYEMLQQPRTLWIIFPISLMLAGVVMSASRGGLLSLFLAAGVGLVIQSYLVRHGRNVAVGLILLAMCTAAVAWVGLDRLERRLVATGSGEGVGAASRLGMWTSAWQVFLAFPVFGIGGGVYEYFDELQRQEAESPGVIVLHAHNELMEALVEGGLVRALWTVTLAGLAVRAGWRALSRHRENPNAGLITGLFIAILALVFHSLVEFSIHVPAVAVLATVLIAHLDALASPREPTATWQGWIPLGIAASLATLGLILTGEGWRHYQVMRHRTWAARCLEEAGTATGELKRTWLQRRLDILMAVLPMAADHAMLRLEIDDAHQKLLDHEHQEVDAIAGFEHAREYLLLGTQPYHLNLPLVYQRLLFGAYPELYTRKEAAHRSHFARMVAQVQHARDVCPVQFRAQLRLAALSALAPAGAMEPAANYLERAKQLAPFRSDLWFQVGLNYWAQWNATRLGRGTDDAQLRARMAESWRHCLEMSDRMLEEILVRGIPTMSPETLANEVLPANPRILFAAAQFIAKTNKDLPARLPLLRRLQNTVRARLEAQVASADDLYLLALALWDMGQVMQAKEWFDQALAKDENHFECRYHRARWNAEQGRFAEARRDLEVALLKRPDFAPARELLSVVEKQLRELRRP